MFKFEFVCKLQLIYSFKRFQFQSEGMSIWLNLIHLFIPRFTPNTRHCDAALHETSTSWLKLRFCHFLSLSISLADHYRFVLRRSVARRPHNWLQLHTIETKIVNASVCNGTLVRILLVVGVRKSSMRINHISIFVGLTYYCFVAIEWTNSIRN